MDDPPFYRDDLQAYYDIQIAATKEEPEAISAVKKKFKLKTVEVTPTGEVRSPGIIDNPNPPKSSAPPPPEGEEPPPPPPEPEPAPGSQMGSENPKDESVDEVWLHYLDETELPIPDFEQWILDARPALASSLEGWTYPTADRVSLGESRARLAKMREEREAVEQAGRYAKFMRLVNMRPLAIREHLRSDTLRETLDRGRRQKTESIRLGIKAARHVMRLKGRPIEEWTEADWRWCSRITRFIERTCRTTSPLLDEDGRPTRKLLALRAWGHDPLVETTIDESEVAEMVELGLTKLIDPHVNGGPVQIVAEGEKGPQMKTLQANRKPLTSAERAKVLEKGAVWHHGPKGQETPAVWKAVVDGAEWFATNTHRAYAVARTLVGAVSRYHKSIKATA